MNRITTSQDPIIEGDHHLVSANKSSAADLAILSIAAIGILFFGRVQPPAARRGMNLVAGQPNAALVARLKADTGEPWLSSEGGPHGLPPMQGPLASIGTGEPLPKAPGPLRIQSLFPKFKHEPFDTAGFNALALPFRHESTDQSGDDTEAMALTFLLSSDLDWAPGSYCSRHAYFVYRRSHDEMVSLRKKYDPLVIANLIKDWKSTCAVGGVMRRTADGCTATLEIYGPDGAVVHTADFKSPRSFFDLLGDLSCDALTFFNAPPSPALNRHLHLERCKDPESLLRLGATAGLPARDRGEFKALSLLLENEPDFAEVRAWLANQRNWSNDDLRLKQREMLRAEQSRLTPALDDTGISDCQDPAMLRQFAELLDAAEKLVGPRSPIVLRGRLQLCCQNQTLPKALYQQALASCREYPNDYLMCCQLGDDIFGNLSSPVDDGLVGSLAGAITESRGLLPTE